jgi:carboxylesterase type B
MHSILGAIALLPLAIAAPKSSPLVVRTSTGYYTGIVDQNFTDVREFLNVPYALSTAGKNRFMPPQPVPFSSEHFDATDYAPFCPQYVSGNPAIWNKQIPQYLSLWSYNGSFFAPENFQTGEPATFASEDCLSLAIWTPKNATSASQLPVALFWTGGGYQTNGILVPGQLPPRWVSRTQEHIVVTINYRMNILGFPNSGAIEDQNLGLLDQRMSLEWVRDNIVHFGGDPSRIMIWGQSAGAGSVDFYNFAYWDDPIAHGIFAESGNAYNGAGLTDPEHTNFTFVAKNVGCDYPTDYEAELKCMQQVDANKIVAFMGHYQDKSNSQSNPSEQPKIAFSVVADGRTAWQNNTGKSRWRALARDNGVSADNVCH